MRLALDCVLLLGYAAVAAREEKWFARLERRLKALEEEVRAAGEMNSRLDEVDRAVGKADQRLPGVGERLREVESSRSVGEAGQAEKPGRRSHERPFVDDQELYATRDHDLGTTSAGE